MVNQIGNVLTWFAVDHQFTLKRISKATLVVVDQTDAVEEIRVGECRKNLRFTLGLHHSLKKIFSDHSRARAHRPPAPAPANDESEFSLGYFFRLSASTICVAPVSTTSTATAATAATVIGTTNGCNKQSSTTSRAASFRA
jgi:hypothetical protein